MISLLRGAFLSLFYLVHTFIFSSLILLFGSIGFLIPLKALRKQCSKIMVTLAHTWAVLGTRAIVMLTPTQWEVEGLERLDPQKSYLLIANHQSWADIMVLYQVIAWKAPFLRYFIKKELLSLPMVGWVWRMLNFPCMYRYSKEYLAKYPEMKGKDIESTRKACAVFREVPLTLVNFVEGTRFTLEKHASFQSPFTHLLPPKAGGVGYALMALGERIDAMLDVTIIYSPSSVSLWDLLSGKIAKIKVHIGYIPLTEQLKGDYEKDLAYRKYFQGWLNDVWKMKDQRISSFLREDG